MKQTQVEILEGVNSRIKLEAQYLNRPLTEVEKERVMREEGLKPKRPRFTKQDVRYAARVVAFPEVPDVFYAETSDGLQVTGQLTGTGLEPATVRCKLGEENRMRTGFIRFLCDGPSRDRLRK